MTEIMKGINGRINVSKGGGLNYLCRVYRENDLTFIDNQNINYVFYIFHRVNIDNISISNIRQRFWIVYF